MPLAQGAGLDLVWLGVMMLVAMEIGLLTPPFGLLLLVMQSVAPSDIGLSEVYRAAAPFVLLELMLLLMVFCVPWLATALPGLMR